MNTSFVNNHINNLTNNNSIDGIVTENALVTGNDGHHVSDFPTNPITRYFIIEKQVGSFGPELVWKVYDAIRRQDKIHVPCLSSKNPLQINFINLEDVIL
ncbi:unnamed protein product [Heterobilharzia americana]|nr:unnamed protein product [Heterobilharzia americana]